MPAEIPEALRRIRNRWPVARCDAKTWQRIDALASSGDPEQEREAEALAKACTLEHPRLRHRHQGALEARKRRQAFLRAQTAAEGPVRAALARYADRAATAVGAAASDDGKVSPGRLAGLLARLKALNQAAYAEVSKAFLALLRTAAKAGLQAAMGQGEAVVASVRQAREGWAPPPAPPLVPGDELLEVDLAEADPLRQKVTFGVRASVFQRLFKGALRQTMQAGLFGKTGVSSRVWDLRDENYLRLKRLTGAGIAAGKSAAAISRDIRGLLLQPATLRGQARAEATPGRGVYVSAYKNAMRLTRTESNRAYNLAGAGFAAEKEWKVVWQVSTGQRERDECDELNGKEMTPEQFADNYPQHPQCLLPGMLIMAPDIVAGAKSFYQGRIVEITTVDGRFLAVTENHPILTDRGWCPAQFINKAHNVIVATEPERIVQCINPDHNDGPAPIEQILDTLWMARSMSAITMKPAPEDFHGDGRNLHGQIYVVRTDSLLGRYRQAFLAQTLQENTFRERGSKCSPFTAGRETAAMLHGLLSTTHGAMARFRHSSPVLRSQSGEMKGLSGLHSTQFNSQLRQPLAKVSSTDIERTREFQKRCAAFISTARVVQVNFSSYSGHVYDLQADVFGLYIANGVIVKNCLCYYTVAVPEVG